jgi:hypothetical protein
MTGPVIDTGKKAIDQLGITNQQLTQEIKDKQDQVNNAHDLMMSEAIGRGGKATTGQPGRGPVYKERQTQYEKLQNEFQDLKNGNNKQIEENQKKIDDLQNEISTLGKLVLNTQSSEYGLLAQLSAYSSLSSKNPILWMIGFSLTFLFVLLGSAPVLLKLLAGNGPYDEMYESLMISSPLLKDGIEADSKEHLSLDLDSKPDALPPGEPEPKKFDPYRLVGTVLAGKYLLQDYAGGGGMGAVYRSVQQGEDKPIAIKILKPDIVVRNAGYSILFERECQAVKKLSHPNIVRVLDVGSNEHDIPFMAMEWLDGQTLEQVLMRGSLSIDRVMKIFVQICEALEYAHERNIIHLDIKPGNVFLLTKDGEADYVKVIDFGVARIISSESGTTVTRFLGTYQYCSPEHFGGKVSNRSDIYSLGATLYHMITGVIPFSGSYINAKKHPNLNAPPLPSLLRIRPDLPKEIDVVIRKSLSKKPNDRHESVRQLLEDLQRALMNQTV